MRLAFIGLMLVLSFTGVARAQAPAPSPQALEEAKRHFQQGVALYNDGNFNGALAEFEAAYAARPSAGLRGGRVGCRTRRPRIGWPPKPWAPTSAISARGSIHWIVGLELESTAQASSSPKSLHRKGGDV